MPSVTTTYLQMSSFSELKARRSENARFAVRELLRPQWQLNRFLYDLVGRAWQWRDKARWSDSQWEEYASSKELRTFLAMLEGNIVGYYELRRDEAASVEIAYFGLVAEFLGQGFGAAMLSDAIERAWQWEASRVWVHTCTLDHPAALKNYLARGMTIYDARESVIPE